MHMAGKGLGILLYSPCHGPWRFRHSACVWLLHDWPLGHYPHFSGPVRGGRTMKTLTTGLLGMMLLAGVAQADVFVSRDAKGDYVLSNVHRPGRQYERVVREVEAAGVSLDRQPHMIAARPYAELVSKAAMDNQLPAALLHAVIQAESHYDAGAVSPKGAGGLMQLMPDTP